MRPRAAGLGVDVMDMIGACKRHARANWRQGFNVLAAVQRDATEHRKAIRQIAAASQARWPGWCRLKIIICRVGVTPQGLAARARKRG